MREMLNDLYRECSKRTPRDRNQAQALANAAALLGAAGVPGGALRSAYSDLKAVFE